MKRITHEVYLALKACTKVLPENEFSRKTGVSLWMVKRFLDRQTDLIKEETWDKIYPLLQPYLESTAEPVSAPPPILGRSARRHPELVSLCSDQKIAIDLYNSLGSDKAREMTEEWEELAGDRAEELNLTSLTDKENRILSFFNALDDEDRQNQLKKYSAIAAEELKKQRQSMF